MPTQHFERVCVVGLGYIGLPTAAFLAASGLSVAGVDIKQSFVESINRGKVPFVEKGFDALLSKVVSDGSLVAQMAPTEADAFIIAVPTPFAEDHKVDDRFVMAAAETVSRVLRGGELVILESTSPVGLTERVAEKILSLRPDLCSTGGEGGTVHFAHCPERVLPGRIMQEMSQNDRIIGGLTPTGTELAHELYETFCRGEMLLTDARTAEMAKLTENSFRDVNIAFANELSMICDELNINVWELIELSNHHPRVNILQPGPGVGGHCIAVDPWFIVSASPRTSNLIRTARETNDSKPEFVLKKAIAEIETLPNPEIAVLGLSFKANIDDLRESPAVEIVRKLAVAYPNNRIAVVEPNINELPSELNAMPNIVLTELDSALRASNVVLLLVDHKEFLEVEPLLLAGKKILDTRGSWPQLRLNAGRDEIVSN